MAVYIFRFGNRNTDEEKDKHISRTEYIRNFFNEKIGKNISHVKICGYFWSKDIKYVKKRLGFIPSKCVTLDEEGKFYCEFTIR